MKVRNGFVSNSSSSSFIMGIGIVTDTQKLNNWFNENSIKGYNMVRFSEIKEGGWEDILRSGNKAYVTAFTNQEIAVDISKFTSGDSISAHEEAKQLLVFGNDPIIFWFDESGPKPGYDEEIGEYEYDRVDLDWFDDNDKKMYEGLRDNKIPGVTSGDVLYGAGFSG